MAPKTVKVITEESFRDLDFQNMPLDSLLASCVPEIDSILDLIALNHIPLRNVTFADSRRAILSRVKKIFSSLTNTIEQTVSELRDENKVLKEKLANASPAQTPATTRSQVQFKRKKPSFPLAKIFIKKNPSAPNLVTDVTSVVASHIKAGGQVNNVIERRENLLLIGSCNTHHELHEKLSKEGIESTYRPPILPRFSIVFDSSLSVNPTDFKIEPDVNLKLLFESSFKLNGQSLSRQIYCCSPSTFNAVIRSGLHVVSVDLHLKVKDAVHIRSCFNCGEFGHMTKQCKKPTTSLLSHPPTAELACLFCKKNNLPSAYKPLKHGCSSYIRQLRYQKRFVDYGVEPRNSLSQRGEISIQDGPPTGCDAQVELPDPIVTAGAESTLAPTQHE